jgi:ABC transport system ATP-binding/permease protein
MHKLTIEDDEGKTVVVPLIREEITVGRQEGNSIRLTERNISRRHARFYRQNGTLFVEDLGSYNGIKVNGTRIAEATGLKDADLVVVGDYKLTVRSDRPVQTRLYAGGAPFSPATGGPTAVPAGTLVGAPGLSSVPASGAGAGTSTSATVPAATPLRPGTLPAAPAPDAALDAAPTIPVRTLAEQGLAAGDTTAPARLVVVSTNLAGSDFLLDRASLVIGRTPENDIVLNHKSISRHHAKIIRDGDKYIVVDLESANGVRVNGSEFERVELQTGDTLELGHVRLKFAAGNEYIDFEAATAGSGKRKMIIAGAVGAVALAGIVLTLAAGDDSADRSGTVAQRPAESATPVTPATSEPAVAVPAAPDPALEPLLNDARAAIQREDWTGALDHVKRALEKSPTSADAATLRETIDSEQAASERWTRLKTASDQRKYEEVLALFPTIPEKSVYRPRAVPLKQTAERKLIDQSLSDAEKAQGRGQCEEAQKAVDRVTAIDPDNTRARAVAEKCQKENAKLAEKQARQAEQEAQLAAKQEKQRLEREAAATARAVASAPTPRERPTSSVTEIKTPPTPRASPPERPVATVARAEVRSEGRSEGRPDPEPAAPRPSRAAIPRVTAPSPAPAAEPMPTGDPEAMLNEATQSWLRGQYAAAIETSRKALKIRPNTARAYQIIAVCSCSLRDVDGATKAYERLEDRMKPLVKSACQKNGISLQ